MCSALRFLGFVWALPLTLVGLGVAIISRPSRWRMSGFVIEVNVERFLLGFGISPAARTLGCVIACGPNGDRPHIVAHERRHVLQCMVLGPLQIVLYPLASFWAHVRGGHYYEDNVFERDATRVEEKWVAREIAQRKARP